MPLLTSFLTESGVAATRRSAAEFSVGKNTDTMNAPPVAIESV
jgi:hypothetical protein